jgi:hypothetical protein
MVSFFVRQIVSELFLLGAIARAGISPGFAAHFQLPPGEAVSDMEMPARNSELFSKIKKGLDGSSPFFYLK